MRNPYSISHLSHKSLDIGRIQTLTIIPVEAGCAVELNLQGIARLAPTRKEIVSDCHLLIAAFFVPYRITSWGQEFIDFIKKGPTGTPFSPSTIALAADYRTAPYLCLNNTGATISKALVEGYNRIFYNFFSVQNFPFNADDPSGATYNTDWDWFPTTETGADRCRLYGRLAARLPHVLNGGNMVDTGGVYGWQAQSLTDADQEVPIDVGTGTYNLTDMAKIQGRYKSKVAAAWFAHNYQDIMQERFGSNIGPDADPSNLLPHLLGVERMMMSGHDIDGTDAQTLGTFQGKTMTPVQFNMRRKYFEEHGLIYIMAVPRYPLAHTDEAHPLLIKTSYTYDEISGDPETVGANTPVQFNPQNWLTSTSTYVPTDNVKEPFGQHYRFQNNTIHPNFKTIPGYPFSSWNGASNWFWMYYLNNEYRETFNTTQIGQAQIQALITGTKFSNIPGVSSSYFAGT